MVSFHDLRDVDLAAVARSAAAWQSASAKAGQGGEDLGAQVTRLGEIWRSQSSTAAQKRLNIMRTDAVSSAETAAQAARILEDFHARITAAHENLLAAVDAAEQDDLTVDDNGRVSSDSDADAATVEAAQQRIDQALTDADQTDRDTADRLAALFQRIRADAQEAERRAIVARAYRALTEPQGYKVKSTGDQLRKSVPDIAHDRNYLGDETGRTMVGKDGQVQHRPTDENVNQYDNFVAKPWCAAFVSEMWDHQDVPKDYKSSQAYLNEVGGRFHPYSPNELPQPGDAIVWSHQSKEKQGQGHVELVTAVDQTTGRITVIGGNTGHHSESIQLKTYDWRRGLDRGDLKFAGISKRFP